MSIVRVKHNKENPYVMINKNGLADPDLSWSAKGLWAYLLSLPDDWKISVQHLSKIFKGRGGGEEAIWALLKELINLGYCEKIDRSREKGQYTGVEYVIKEFKEIVPYREKPDPAKADPVNAGYTKEEVLQRNETTTTTKEEEVVAVSFDEKVIQTAQALKIFLMEFSKTRTKEWIIHETFLIKAMQLHGIQYVVDQINYMCKQQQQAEEDAKNGYKKDKKKPIREPNKYFHLATLENYAYSTSLLEMNKD